jgi:hypothetical protein
MHGGTKKQSGNFILDLEELIKVKREVSLLDCYLVKSTADKLSDRLLPNSLAYSWAGDH